MCNVQPYSEISAFIESPFHFRFSFWSSFLDYFLDWFSCLLYLVYLAHQSGSHILTTIKWLHHRTTIRWITVQIRIMMMPKTKKWSLSYKRMEQTRLGRIKMIRKIFVNGIKYLKQIFNARFWQLWQPDTICIFFVNFIWTLVVDTINNNTYTYEVITILI